MCRCYVSGSHVETIPAQRRAPMDDETREDQPGEPGSGDDKDTIPAAPSDDDDSAAGDTDQHSSADA